jgi:hypothetical protein
MKQKSSMEDDCVDLFFGIASTHDQYLLGLALPDEAKHFGGPGADIYNRDVRLRIGRRPTVIRLRTLFKQLGRDVPAEFEVFREYEIWIVAHHLNLLEERGLFKIREFGCRVDYTAPCGTIIAHFPETEFIQSANGEFSSSVDLSVEGQAKLPSALSSASLGIGGPQLELGGGVRVSQSAKAAIHLSFRVMSPKAIATGNGDHLGEWIIHRANDQPLIGEQNFVHLLLLPNDANALNYQIQSFVTVDVLGMFPVRMNSEWVKFSAQLDREATIAVERDTSAET